ncbi:type II restriction endonuclease [Sphingobacterium faecium NBRC 15299]|uniref:type II restriction endonuclease n=1 Tax=Sphingobacterium faecium TaxID=34087 RepID=UPI000D34573E|nr:type II restriction endonuclease [Sphingobacterium faecium]PTX14114.1 EcoRII-like protein [Sphingobacterium faecium]GEM64194.1 type II restriction endonuclease [Sphingobacterium faecium NBRC 15299]
MSVKISDHFIGIAAKRLSRVEIFSHQHEFNGINAFRNILGNDRLNFKGNVIYFADDEEKMIDNASDFTWYDARENNPKRSAEFRLYFSDPEVVPNALVGDLVIMGKTIHNELTIIVAEQDSTAEKQLLFLFGLEEVENRFIVRDFREDYTDIGFAGKYILESIGIEIEIEDEVDYLQIMQDQFGMTFPTTAIFSQFARSTVSDVSILDDPDHALISWWDREGELLRIFERAVVGERIREGFGDDVDGFIQFALTVINRRKSRAGHSFENHLQTIFDSYKIKYSKGAKTERKNRPDFIFPSVDAYRDSTYPEESLHMLGVKTTAKDRWRQVLSEADRVSRKHLITLEPAISKSQTDEMEAQNLQLIIPVSLHQTYLAEQMMQIIDLKTFINKLS